jgi:hypothetical protein
MHFCGWWRGTTDSVQQGSNTRSIPFAISTEFLKDPEFLTIPCYGIESGNEHHFKNHVKESDNDPQSCRSGFADQAVLAADV